MRKFAIASIALSATLLTGGPVAFAQQGNAGKTPPPKPGLEVPLVTPGPGCKACPHCENEAYATEDRNKANVEPRAINAPDLSGDCRVKREDVKGKGVPL